MSENYGMITELLHQFSEINNGLAQIIGQDPIMIASVVILVTMVDVALKVRDRYQAHADMILLSLCVLMSILVSFITIDEIVSWKQLSRHALVLSGLTTLSYRFGKPIIKKIVLSKLKKMEKASSPEEV